MFLSAIPAMRSLAGADAPILMPPFLVEEQKDDGIEWIYGSGDGIRVLSGCGTDETSGFVQQLIEQRDELRKLIPDGFLLREDLPVTLIVYPKSHKQALDEILEKELREGAVGPTRQFTPMNDLRLSDPDSSDIFIVFDDALAKTDVWIRGGGRTHSINYPTPVRSPAYVRFLLQARAPVLPDWYVCGCVGLYETMNFQEAANSSGSPFSSEHQATDGASFEPDLWISPGDVSSILRSPDGPRPLVPMRELFAARYPSSKSDRYRQVWEAQSELFVRWALSGRVEGGPERLRRLVEGATSQRTTEEFFYACFGMGYSDALEALSDFLPHAVGKPIFIPSGPALHLPTVDFRTATRGEVRRIKSEWSRRVLAAIRKDDPGAFPHFCGKVRGTLEDAFASGERDPDFLATLALFRIQYGDPNEGLLLLNQFPEAAATRPVARLELVQQHLLEALAKPQGAKGTLGEVQARGLMHEIFPFPGGDPLESAYKLAAKVYGNLGRDPTPEERRILAEGARRYPRNSQLVVQASAWELRAGEASDAAELIEFGLWENVDPLERKSLVVLDNLARQSLTESGLKGRDR